MKKSILFSLASLVGLFATAQLVNNGGTIIVQQGAYVVCAGALTNTGGTITNDGRIEVKGAFTNTGTYTSTAAEDSVILSGSGNAVLSLGSAAVNYLTINKSANTDVVTLGSSAAINKKLDYLAGGLSTDYATNPSFVLSAPRTATFNFAAGREIIGTVKRTGWANGSTVIFNSPQMQITTASGTAPTDITVTMLAKDYGGDPSGAEREVKRKFLFAQNGGANFTADIRFPYAAGEFDNNNEANLVPWTLVSNEWNARLTPVTRSAANKWVATTGIPAASLSQEWKLADPKYTFTITANLRGAWNGTDMSAAVNSILPIAQPYNVAPFNYAGTDSVSSIPSADVVDWVLVELRKPTSGLAQDATISTIIGRKAGFLLRNGTVVDLDGATPISFDISKQGSSFVAIRHRNHLGVLSNVIPSNAVGNFANDFTVLANAYKAAGAPTDPLVLLSGGAKRGLWAGDANKNGVVNITDVNAIKVAIAGSATGYLFTDVNLSNSINVTDVNVTKTTISASGGGSIPARMAATGKVRTNLPDPVNE